MEVLAVVGAVAAVVSAFHGGAELVAHIKKKRRRRSKSGEFEEKQLQDSLHEGEVTVERRWNQDVREFGEIVRRGDAIAHDRLLHIAVVVQAEIIRSLQLAVHYDNMVVDLKSLHETSILNRREALTTLDELKQRILLTRNVPRPFGALPPVSPDLHRGSVATIESLQSVRAAPAPGFSTVPDDYIPKAVTLASLEDKDSKGGLANFLWTKRHSNSSSAGSTSPPPTYSADNMMYPPGRYHSVQGQGTSNLIVKDIDEIISSYRGLRLDHNQRDTLAAHSNGAIPSSVTRRDTLAVLSAGEDDRRDTMGLNRDAAIQILSRNLPPTPEETHEDRQQYPAFNQHVFDQQSHAYSQYPPPAQAHMSVPQQHDTRWSISSSVYSDAFPPSHYSHDSKSSNESNSRAPSIALELSANGFPVPPSSAPQRPAHLTPGHEAPSRSSSNSSNSRYSFGIPTQAASAPPVSSAPSYPPPSSLPPTHPLPSPPSLPPAPSLPLAPSLPPIRPAPSDTSSSSTVKASPLSPSAPHPSQFLKHSPSTTSTSTSNSNPSISKGTIAGPHPSQVSAMSGRPCKDNNYWGFCKGAWAVREELKKGLGVQIRPVGMITSIQIWQCKHCNFWGNTFSGPNAKKRKDVIVNPNVYTSAVGIRYKWIFLAKSHVKRTAVVVAPNAATKGNELTDCNFGCVICSVEGNVTGIYGNVETLMNHIYLEHARGLDDKVAIKSRFIVGRMAGRDEEWDLNCPSVQELE